jgi:uncharacterized cupin superfamily protein
MADYTHLNIKDDFDNAAEKFGLAPDLEARFGRSALGLEGGGFSYQRLAPDFAQPFGHRHAAQEEVAVVIAGSGRVKLDGEVRELRQWDALRLPPAVARAFAAGPDGMELLVMGFGAGGDGETIDGYWDES